MRDDPGAVSAPGSSRASRGALGPRGYWHFFGLQMTGCDVLAVAPAALRTVSFTVSLSFAAKSRLACDVVPITAPSARVHVQDVAPADVLVNVHEKPLHDLVNDAERSGGGGVTSPPPLALTYNSFLGVPV